MQKDDTVADITFLSCLKFWPKTDPYKELIFLKEIELVMLAYLKNSSPKPLVSASLIVRQIAKCSESQHFHVAEKGLLLLTCKEF